MNDNLYIFSVYQANKTLDTNVFNHYKLFESLWNDKKGPTHVLISENGEKKEGLYLGGDNDCFKTVRSLCKEFNQDSCYKIEYLDGWKTSKLKDNKCENIGILTEVSPIIALNKYKTYFIISDRYYVIK